MKERELLDWLQLQRPKLDLIISKAARDYHDVHKHRVNFGYDLAECQFESYNLVRKKDLCYDRANTAFTYSLWYHARRINTFLSHFAKAILNTSDKTIEIFDLGAGTGAVQWAIGLIYHKLKESGVEVPKIKIVNVDSSPFMLYYSRDYLWKHFLNEYAFCNDFDNSIAYEINSWSNSKRGAVTNPWLTVSYLFDISDTENSQTNLDYQEAVKAGFNDLITLFNPSTILLLTSDQPAKRDLLNTLQGEFVRNGYTSQAINNASLLLKGPLEETSKFRKELFDDYLTSLTTLEAKALSKNATWADASFVGTILTKQQSEMHFSNSASTGEIKRIKLYNEPMVVRRDVVLNPDQKKAAEHSDRPAIITGPAGCGKSVVITERIKNLCEALNYDPVLNILVTTFNKQLMIYLSKWIDDLLDKSKSKRVGNTFVFKNSKRPNITLLHFDVLPTRLGIALSHLPITFKEHHCNIIERCIEEIKQEKNITTNKYDNVLNADYILDEYQRIIYGYQISRKEEYLTTERKGRPKLQIGGIRRQLLWEIIVEKYLKHLKSESFITKRHKFLRQLKRGEVKAKFSHIFVDEFQDCTFADYEIFYLLLIDPNNLVLGGDIAQAIQLGAVADIPRVEGDMMARRAIFRLKGSYRLPFRVSECILGISALTETENTVVPYKGAPPGARPIVVYSKSIEDYKNKLTDIYNCYRSYGLNRITILETDYEIRNILRFQKIECETDTILRLKGLEKTCVLWSTRKDIAYKEEISEFVYTILSRTTSILIISLSDNTLLKYHRIINLLRKDRLILWDLETKDSYNRFCFDESKRDIGEDED
jgi:DNA helicase-2/ATP-dependent DNA helicase PcrA